MDGKHLSRYIHTFILLYSVGIHIKFTGYATAHAQKKITDRAYMLGLVCTCIWTVLQWYSPGLPKFFHVHVNKLGSTWCSLSMEVRSTWKGLGTSYHSGTLYKGHSWKEEDTYFNTHQDANIYTARRTCIIQDTLIYPKGV